MARSSYTAEQRENHERNKAWRASIFQDTKKKVTLANYSDYLKVAEENRARYEKNRGLSLDNLSFTVNVAKLDSLDAAEYFVRNFGEKPAVLNMANAYRMGGGVEDGAGAQEENMFRRTGCYLNTTGGIFINDARNVFDSLGRYSSWFTAEINGINGNVPVFEAMCFKKQEADNYVDLRKDEIFPFYELRSAAQDLRKEGSVFDAARCEKSIRAQFKMISLLEVKAAVLSAFGCGAFANPPDQVASIYKKVIDDVVQNKSCPKLKWVVFALINPNNPHGEPGENFTIFQKHLHIPITTGQSSAVGATDSSDGSGIAPVEDADTKPDGTNPPVVGASCAPPLVSSGTKKDSDVKPPVEDAHTKLDGTNPAAPPADPLAGSHAAPPADPLAGSHAAPPADPLAGPLAQSPPDAVTNNPRETMPPPVRIEKRRPIPSKQNPIPRAKIKSNLKRLGFGGIPDIPFNRLAKPTA